MKSTNIYEKINDKGITIISLSVTVIVLIILAGITLSTVIDENGFLQIAKKQSTQKNTTIILQELEIVEGYVAREGNINLEKYIDYITQKGVNGYKVTEIIKIDETNTKIIIDEKYKYIVTQIENDILIKEEEYIGENGPEIVNFIVKEKNTNSITVQVKATKAINYEFYIKGPKDEYKKVGEKKASNYINAIDVVTYTYDKLHTLNEGEVYKLKVVAKRENKKVEKEIDSNIENVVPAQGNVTIVSAPIEWTNKKITTTVQTVLEDYIVQYQINSTNETIVDDSKWINYTKGIVSEKNEVIYIRLWDGVNAGEITSQEITKIDKEAPIGSVEITSKTTNKMTVKVTASDKQATTTNGMSDIKGYYYSSDNGSTYSSITTSAIYEFTNLSQTSDYNIKVIVEDNAGNKETLSVIGKTNSIPTPTITISDTSVWKTEKTITISSENGYTVKYTTDGTLPSKTNGTLYNGEFTVDKNCTIIAAYFDSINQMGQTSSNTVTKVDSKAPTGSLEVAVANTTSVTVTVSATEHGNCATCSGNTQICSGAVKNCSGGYSMYYYRCQKCGTYKTSLSSTATLYCSDRNCSTNPLSLNGAAPVKCSHESMTAHTYLGSCSHGYSSLHTYCEHNTKLCSGIKGYYYSTDGGITYRNITTSEIYKFIGTKGLTYDIKVKVEDNAGNQVILSKTITI